MHIEYLKCHLSLVLGLLTVHENSVLVSRKMTSSGTERSSYLPQTLSVLSSKDSAVLIYPVFLPVIIVLTLLKDFSQPFLASIILSLCALPSQLFALGHNSYNYNYLQWLFTLLPMITGASRGAEEIPASQDITHPSHVDTNYRQWMEIFVLLYPLHSSLLTIIYYLTSSSLLPAESQLLSVLLINLYLFSVEPIAVILKAVIWVGGFGLLFTCRGAAERHNQLMQLSKRKGFQKEKPKRQGGLIPLVKTFLSNLLGKGRALLTECYYTQSEAIKKGKPARYVQKQWTTVGQAEVCRTSWKIPSQDQDIVQNSVDQDCKVYHNVNYVKNGLSMSTRGTRKSIIDFGPALMVKRLYSVLDKAKNSSFICTMYIYLMIVAIVLWPFKLYISMRALHDHEAIGWVIGYLFGNIQAIRQRVQEYELQSWIPLPPSASSKLSIVTIANSHLISSNTGTTAPASIRLLIVAYWLFILVLGLFLVLSLPFTTISGKAEAFTVDNRRKIFHGMIVLVLVPAAPFDPPFVSFALAVVLALFLLLEVLRAAQLPPLSKPLTVFLAPYVDSRDLAGPLVVSHIFLLLGCALPFWLSLAASSTYDSPDGMTTDHGSIHADFDIGTSPWKGWEYNTAQRQHAMGMLAGVVCVGLGDAAASLVGRRYGHTKWPWSGGKSFEGSVSFAAALFTGLCVVKAWLLLWGNLDVEENNLANVGSRTFAGAKILIVACGASLLEAVLVGGNDNIIVPILLWVGVRDLKV